MSGEYYAELENNHHYTIVDTINDRTYYCPSRDVANILAHKLNNYVKIIRRVRRENNHLKQVKKIPVYEIRRELDESYEHVAFVDDETLAQTFCEHHKDCSYGPLTMTRYPLSLEAEYCSIPCCETCSYCDKSIPDEESEGYCRNYEDNVSLNGKCEDWTSEEL